MKKVLLMMVLVVSCSDNHISNEELLKKADDFCSCHSGVWYVGRLGHSGIVEIRCNNGTYSTIDERAIVKRMCK